MGTARGEVYSKYKAKKEIRQKGEFPLFIFTMFDFSGTNFLFHLCFARSVPFATSP